MVVIAGAQVLPTRPTPPPPTELRPEIRAPEPTAPASSPVSHPDELILPVGIVAFLAMAVPLVRWLSRPGRLLGVSRHGLPRRTGKK